MLKLELIRGFLQFNAKKNFSVDFPGKPTIPRVSSGLARKERTEGLLSSSLRSSFVTRGHLKG